MRQVLSLKKFSWDEKQRPAGLTAVMNCPFCDDRGKKFGISLETGAFSCLRQNNCGIKGSWYEFQKRLGLHPVRLDNESMVYGKKRKRTYKKPDIHGTKLTEKGLAFLYRRGFTDEIIKEFKLGETKDGKAIMFPYFKNDEVVGVKYRLIDRKKMWKELEQEPVLYNRDKCRGDTLIITEGEPDTIALKQYQLDSVSIPGGVNDMSWIEHEWAYLQQFKSIYLIMDYDIAGRKAVEQISLRLGKWRCYNVVLPYKDVNACLIKKVDHDVILECINNARGCTIHNLVSAGYFIEQVKELFNNRDKLHGVTTGIQGLDYLLKGWRDEELTIWTGRTSSGKSTFLNQIILNLAGVNVSSCIASLEMPPVRYLRWAVLQHSEHNVITDHIVEVTLNWLDKYMYIVNSTNEMSVEEILNVFEYAARKYGVKHFIIDSLMRIRFEYQDELKEQKLFCSRLVSFAKQYKCHVHLVAHPRKASRDSATPDKVDVSGTGNITNLAHNVLVMYRISDDMKENNMIHDNILYVKKNREWGKEGKVKLSFDVDRKLFKEV